MDILKDRKVAILVADGFEEVEFTEPKKALERAGATVHVISPNEDKVKAWDSTDWGNSYDVDKALDAALPSDYNSLLLPGGVLNPDQLRANDKAVEFVKHFFEAGKPIAAICHGPWTLIETGALEGRQVTSYKSIKTDLINAGAEWKNEEVVTDQGLVTSRNPDDIPAFCKKMIEEFCEGVHEGQKTI
ncbi:type 1 glutamine amidotransferase domain-containing protein [Fulvivirga ligni]|uniref:type 1 glutamine amidotransferase domain-containing protein n=1 Tax=Fulvivirga ligni TaxID=2904246 RepID=UPI001F2583C5|nr:type 1 glutamine amidotransferase domain-containing protein [Fulvivirga ligni]UII24132.1 type 1 glutamine amidotransferase [Fulvivirga ligni]